MNIQEIQELEWAYREDGSVVLADVKTKIDMLIQAVKQLDIVKQTSNSLTEAQVDALSKPANTVQASLEIINIIDYAARIQDLKQSLQTQAISIAEVVEEQRKLDHEIALNAELSPLAKALVVDRVWSL